MDEIRLRSVPRSAAERKDIQDKVLGISEPVPNATPERNAHSQDNNQQDHDAASTMGGTTYYHAAATEDYSETWRSDDLQMPMPDQNAEMETRGFHQTHRISSTDQFQFESSRASSSTGFAYQTSWPVEEPDVEDDRDSDKNNDSKSHVKRRKLTRMVDIVEVTDNLESETGKSGRFRHYARQASRYAETIFSSFGQSPPCSRSSTGSSAMRSDAAFAHSTFRESPDVRRSEFERFYQCPTRREEIHELELQRMSGNMRESAVSIVVRSRNSDKDAVSLLRQQIPDDPTIATIWVNKGDNNGTSALHLTVAYGLENSSNFLAKHDADFKARTKFNTTIGSFARPAQELAKSDRPLYHRIIKTREFIRRGQIPPVPVEPLPKGKTSPSTSPDSQADSEDQISTNDWAFEHGLAPPNQPAEEYFRQDPSPQQRTPWPRAVPSNLGGLAAFDDGTPDFTRGLTMSPVSIRQQRDSVQSINVGGKSGWGRGGPDLRRLVAKRNANRASLPVPPQQPSATSFGNTDNNGYASDFRPSLELHSPAWSSVPNLGSLSSPTSTSYLDDYTSGQFHNVQPSPAQAMYSNGHAFDAWRSLDSHPSRRQRAPRGPEPMPAPTPVHPSADLLNFSTFAPFPGGMPFYQTNDAAQQLQEYQSEHPTAMGEMTATPTPRNVTSEPFQSPLGTWWSSCEHGEPVNFV